VADKRGDIDAARLAERMERLPGIARLREAAQGMPVYLVGGAVRDLLLEREHPDLDLVVEGDVAPLAAALGGELREHERFETATVRENGSIVDLARARTETYGAPGALPDVEPASIGEDLARRDFTINAMAVPLSGEPQLIDPHGGLDDLRTGVLRVLHPGSFADDPTRALRAARYAARLGLELEPETEALLRKADLSTVSRDRERAELLRMASEADPARAFELASQWGLIELADDAPELIRRIERLLRDPAWAQLTNSAAAILLVAEGGDEEARRIAVSAGEPPSLATRLAAERSGEELAVARALGAEWLDRYVSDWRHVGLEIGGEDLIAAGVPEGPAVGAGLEAALDAKLDGEISGREAELAYALAKANDG